MEPCRHWYTMNTQKSRLALAVIAATASLAQSNIVVAADNSYQPTLMNQVTVTATRSEKQLKDVAASVTVVDEEQMEKELVTDIKDLARFEPGVNVGSDGRSGSEGFNIRGMDGNRVKIMVDGVDQAEQFTPTNSMYQKAQRNYVDVDTLKAVEIVKGPSSTLYGSGAIGGIVAFQTKDPADYLKPEGDDTAASVKATYSSADEGFAETFTVANRTGDLESLLVYTRRDNKETKTHSGADITGVARGQADPKDEGSNNLLGKLQYQVNDENRVGLVAEYLDSTSKTNIMSDSMLPSDTTTKDYVTRKRIGVFHEWDANVALFDSLRWQADWQDSETNQTTHVPAYTFMPGWDLAERNKDYLYKQTIGQLSAQLNKDLKLGSQEHQIVYGFDVKKGESKNKNTTYYLDGSQEPVDDSYIPDVDSLTYGVFIQDDIQLTDRWSVSPGVRYDSYEYDPKGKTNLGEEAKGRKGDAFTAGVGTVFDITDSTSVFAQIGQGFKAPGLFETYYNYENSSSKLIANPDLQQEESTTYELGLRGDHEVGNYELTAFFNDYNNFIDMMSVGTDTYQYKNIADAEIKGVEFKSQIWLDSAINAPEGTSLRTAIAYAEGKDKTNGEKMNSVAPLTAVFGLGYDDMSGDWGSELVWTLVKGKSDSDISNKELQSSDQDAGKQQFNPAGYGLVDLTAYYVPVEDVTLRAGLFNITDKKYYEWNDIRGKTSDYAGLDRLTQPGRNVSISVKWDI